MSDRQAYPTPMHVIDEQLLTLLGGLRGDLIPYIGHYEDQGLPPEGVADRELLALHQSSEWLRLRAIYAACDAIQSMIVRSPGWHALAMQQTIKQRQYLDEQAFIAEHQQAHMEKRRATDG